LQETPETEAAEKAVQNYVRRKSQPENKRESMRLIQYLYRMGFSEEAIRSALKRHPVDFDLDG
jgi:SOS response regulatory protein OraA/RecX